ncbi:dolichyl-P-Man:Man(7)GlcNAc(2)-PP-dolichol alpha-1,6-mannosyltransferase [Cichlidogyrus casuarinus]|uniref:Mannosyltransferase n=1 Tax=Cichlidogyrus casuarinus TaxID=1844966 RepID=A0ABD2QGH4_9PLAT
MFFLQILNVLVIAYVILCPFTKVEESFNLQAMHDILYHGLNLSTYDHLEYPGPVPRTFLAPLYLDAIVYPVFYFCSKFISKISVQIALRALLGTLLVRAFGKITMTMDLLKQSATGLRFLAITASQFHLPFYMSRPLPNIFALYLTLNSINAFFRDDEFSFLAFSGFAILVFRSELALFFAPLLLFALYLKTVRISWQTVLFLCVITFHSIALSVLVDSFFWQRVLWPEAEVFHFNVILNKSSQWGTLPFHWYFTNALPKALLLTSSLFLGWLFLRFIGLCNSRIGAQFKRDDNKLAALCLSTILFILGYSFLPHKELRFIIYALPVFNLAAAAFWTFVESKWTFPKHENISLLKVLRSVLLSWCYLHIFINFAASAVFLLASISNYPGGVALRQLNCLSSLNSSSPVHVHISNLAAQTGVSRFLHQHDGWIYNKTEGVEHLFNYLDKSGHFTHIVFDLTAKLTPPSAQQFVELFQVEAFSSIDPFQFKIFYKPVLAVYQRIGWNH